MADEQSKAAAEGAQLIASLIAPVGENSIEALAISVFTAAAKGAEEDLKHIMERVRAMTAAKAALRELITRVNRDAVANAHRDDDRDDDVSYAERGMGGEAAYHDFPLPVADIDAAGGVRIVRIDLHQGPITRSRLDALVDELRSKLDSMSEMGEMESLRLQMIMDRRSKFISTLSNLLKKISDTQDGIVQNLK